MKLRKTINKKYHAKPKKKEQLKKLRLDST
jgi:hypothetical protein